MNDRNELIRGGSDNPFQLAASILDAGRAGDESMAEEIARYLEHDHYKVRGAAIEALVFSMKRGQYFDQAVRMINDPDYAVRESAIYSIGCLARARPEFRERAASVLVDAIGSAEEPLDAHSPYEWLAELGLVPFRQWEEEPPSVVLAAIEAAMGKPPR